MLGMSEIASPEIKRRIWQEIPSAIRNSGHVAYGNVKMYSMAEVTLHPLHHADHVVRARMG